MMTIDTLTTARLTAERLRPGHLAEIAALTADSRVAATLGGPLTAEEAAQRHLVNLEHWERHGFGVWAWRDRATGAFVGRAGLRRVTVEGAAEVELLYALRAEFWGRGLATEMAQALCDVAFGPLGLAQLVAFTLPSNRASRRVMEKAGFAYERDIVHAALPHVLYRRRAGPAS